MVLVAIVAVALAAAGQAVTAIGFSLVAVPFVTLAVGPAAAVPTINLLAGGLNFVMLMHERDHADWRNALRLLVPATIAIPFAAYGVRRLDVDALSVLNGASILIFTGLLATGLRSQRLRGRRGAVIAGALSGATNVATGVGGPVVAMYAVNAEWEPRTFRPTMQAFFLGINIVSLAARGWPDLEVTTVSGMAIATVLGWLVGSRIARRVDDTTVRNAMLITAAVGGAVALVRGLV